MALPPLPPGIAAPVPEAPPAPPASECNDLEFNLENVDKVRAWGILPERWRIRVLPLLNLCLSHFLPVVRCYIYSTTTPVLIPA